MIPRLPPARTWGQAYQRVVEDIKEHGGAERIAVIHTRRDGAHEADLKAGFPEVRQRLLEGTLGPVVGTYAGPGAAGVGYIGKKAAG